MDDFDPQSLLNGVFGASEPPTAAEMTARLKGARDGDDFALFLCTRTAMRDARELDGDPAAVFCAYGEAFTFARLLAASGNVEDQRPLFELAAECGRRASEMGFQGFGMGMEAIGLQVADAMADGGDEGMAEIVARSAYELDPEIFQTIKRQKGAV